METHPLGIEKAEAAVATVKLAHRNARPIILLVTVTITSACSFVLMVINALCLLQSDAAAKCYTGECFSNFVAEFFVHSVQAYA